MDPQQQPTNSPQGPAPGTGQSQFTPSEPPKANKNGLMAAIIVAVVVILGVVAFVMMNSGKDDASKTSNNSNSSANNSGDSKFQTYEVTDKPSGIKFSVSFYKDAKIEEKNGRTFLNVGEEGSLSSVYITAGKTGEIDCGDAPTTTMKLNGQSTKVCYKSDNKQYGGFVTTNGQTVQLNVAGQKAISMDEAKAIMESASFK